ncbi:putative component of membrane protein insertase Oxa1/YidC/SpoIIIJ protein YidD [Rhizobium paknamense]|uniref:Component of membrane protein insertase Oxa1/YidC/SpoIIIJ protein YidD n=1 Tax=Rhizobium paknamense TaxID=1206817 RepID=A0ABU0ICD2_9HYPH|nr:putative component of membrane protein insertase Oxa1/YidC/SpoIIIJ protein YidD [Rhizobium paknamense]
MKRERKLEGWMSGLSITIERAACRPFLNGGVDRTR